MPRAELLLLRAAAHNWGEIRREAPDEHMALYLTLYSDERRRAIWANVVDGCRRAGRPIQTADAWIASAARQWSCPLVTTDFGDYAVVDNLDRRPPI
jgi:predicted nucleic acid-binding protein